jgi:hypothetical protein
MQPRDLPSPVKCPRCQRQTYLVWTKADCPTLVPGCDKCVSGDETSLFDSDYTLHFTPAMEQTGEGGWVVGPNPAVEFISLRCYLDWCIGPDSPIASDLRTYDVVTLCGLIKLLGILAHQDNEIHQRVLKRIGKRGKRFGNRSSHHRQPSVALADSPTREDWS